MSASNERQSQVIKPIFVSLAIAVGVDHHFAPGRFHADVSGVAKAHVALANVTDPGEFEQQFLGVVGGTVIDEYDLVIRIAQSLHRFQTRFNSAGAVVRADDDTAHRQLRIRRVRHAFEHLLHCREGGLGLAVARDDAERPVLDLISVAMPIIGEAEHEGADQPSSKTAWTWRLRIAAWFSGECS